MTFRGASVPFLPGQGRHTMIAALGRAARWLAQETGLRFLARRKAACAAAVLTMSLALGANTTVFSVVRAFLLSSLALPEADRVMLVAPVRELPGRGSVVFNDAYSNYRHLRETQRVFAELTTVLQGTGSWDVQGEARPVALSRVTASFFATMRVPPALGRPFTPDEEGPSAAPVVIISHGLWRSALAGDSAAIGRALRIDGAPHTLVGVMPEGFAQPAPTDVWLPFDLPAPAAWTATTGARQLSTYARLADGITAPAAASAMRDFTRLALERDPAGNRDFTYTVRTLRQALLAGADATVLLVQAAAAVLLLLAVLNLASLLIAWGFDRRQEMTVRLALGAGERHIVQLLVAQALVVVGAGAMIGVALARVAIWGIGRLEFGPGLDYFTTNLVPDSTVLVASAGVAALAAMLAGALPAWFTRRAELADTLRPGTRAVTLSPAALRWQKGMVLAQAALSVVILSAAALIGVSFRNLDAVPDGFDARRRVVVRLQLPDVEYRSHGRRAAFGAALREHLLRETDLDAAGFTSTLPVSDIRWGGRFFTELPEGGLSEEPLLLHVRRISPEYPHAMGIPLVAGRQLEARDDSAGAQVALVSRALAERLWPGLDPIGKRLHRFSTTSPPVPVEVVGVVGNVMDGGYAAPPGETVYMPYTQVSITRMSIVGVARSTPRAAFEAIRRAIRASDPVVAASLATTLENMVVQANALPRLRTMVLGAFALVAVGIVTLGSYGVMSQLVASREREFVIRVVYGAMPGQIGRAVVSQLARLTLPGVLLGLGASILLGESLRPFVFGIEPRSGVVLAAVSLGTFVLALLASAPSIRRAMRVDVRSSTGAV